MIIYFVLAAVVEEVLLLLHTRVVVGIQSTVEAER